MNVFCSVFKFNSENSPNTNNLSTIRTIKQQETFELTWDS